jgi:hypothetical protein
MTHGAVFADFADSAAAESAQPPRVSSALEEAADATLSRCNKAW